MQQGLFDNNTDRSTRLPRGPYVAYADGACKGNGKDTGGRGGWGVLLQDTAGVVLAEIFGGENPTTNNRMELQAAIEALTLVEEGAEIELLTDSQYVCKGLTEWLKGWKAKGWKTASKEPVKNVEYWQVLDALYQKRKVKVTWVRGHNGDPGNERADALANQGVKSTEST